MRRFKLFGLLYLVLTLLVFTLPLVIPVPALADTVAAKDLADEDSRFVTLGGLELHYKTLGEGEPVFLLLHGFGASTFSWREVMAPLAQVGTAVAFDRPAFGLTGRPMPETFGESNPYTAEAQLELTLALLDYLGVERAVLVGHSSGGSLATLFALEHPERVEALVLVSAAIYSGGGAPSWAQPLLRVPQFDRVGPLLARQLAERSNDFLRASWHDPSRLSNEVISGYRQPLNVQDWDRALWELTKASRTLGLSGRLQELEVPVLVVTGDDDRIVATADSVRLAGEIRGASLVVLERCGHLPHEECAEAFMDTTLGWLQVQGLLE